MAKQTLPDSSANRNPVEIIPALNMEFPPPGSILCLDLGGKTGWALKQTDGQITSGTIEFKPGRFEGGGMTFLRFKAWLDEVHSFAGPIHSIYFEEVRRHLGTTAAHIYGGFLACLTSWCEARSIPYQGIPVGTIKKYATGKGNSGKEAVIKAMRSLGHNPVDDNEADALAILHLVLSREMSS
jgi:crossover junction endodeoxyribonuclease RuvC